jgi:phospholipid/cholesterol/gamma-HCH transport system substrate-binding protein
MNPNQASTSTRVRVGLFTIIGLLLIGAASVYVNDEPYWWRPCQLVHISVEDATGLKTKSPIRSLGLDIGYLVSFELSDTHVDLGICITAPVEVLPTTKAYIRAEGFLGDKFVELKPVKYIGPEKPAPRTSFLWPKRIYEALIPEARAEEDARAEDPPPATPPAAAPAQAEPERPPQTGVVKRGKKGEREIPMGKSTEDVQQLVNRVDELVNQMTGLTNNLKKAINPDELKSTMRQLNQTLANASRTFSPEGGLNQTAQRTLAKLEDAIEQLKDQITRVNRGEGSVGMLLNDPSYAKDLKEALENLNRLLTKVGNVRFVVDIGAEKILGYDRGRGWFRLGIWPRPDRYYLLGITVDPRGKITETVTTTQAGGITTVTNTNVEERSGLRLTGMIGKVWWNRVDTSIGVLHDDGTVSVQLDLGPPGHEDTFFFRNDLYSRTANDTGTNDSGIDDRVSVQIRPFMSVYVRGGVESFRRVNGQFPFFFGAGVAFDDDDIKLLFALK